MATDLPSERSLRALLAEIAADRVALRDHARIAGSCLDRAPWAPHDALLSVLAVALHHYYSGAEAIFERVARRFEGLPSGDRWHAELLRAMQLEIPEVRPALLGPALAADLARLLGFRHFFRHAYAVALDPAQLADLAAALVRADPQLQSALDAFDAALRAALDAS